MRRGHSGRRRREAVQNHLENRGVEFRLSESVKRFERNSAVLESGDTLGFDILVLAVGVRPNTALLEGIADIDGKAQYKTE